MDSRQEARELHLTVAVECGDGWRNLGPISWSEFAADNAVGYDAADLAAIFADLAAYGIVYLGGGAGVAYRLVAL